MWACCSPDNHQTADVMTIVATLQVEELNIDMEPGDIVDDILGKQSVPLKHFPPCLWPKLIGDIRLEGGGVGEPCPGHAAMSGAIVTYVWTANAAASLVLIPDCY